MDGAIVVIWLICGAIGYAIGNSKGKGGTGLALGLLLGIIGVIICLFLSPSLEKKMEEQRQMQAMYGSRQYGVAAPVVSATPAGWYPDPHGRADVRYWDGARWTANISRGGVQSVEGSNPPPMPPGAAAARPLAASVEGAKFCGGCGTSVQATAAFCSSCGRSRS